MKPPLTPVRDMKDFSVVRRDGAWILGCVAAAVGFCYLAPEYGYTPVVFFSLFCCDSCATTNHC